MNALYLGPYRQNNDEGVLSRLYLDRICSTFNTVSRPIYINRRSTDTQAVFKSESTDLKHFDVLIQHLPINNLAIDKRFNHNICIPILNNSIINNDQINKLNLFDKILIDNTYLYKVLSKKIKSTKYNLIRPDISKIQSHSNKFNLSAYEFTQKIYTICDFQNNIDLIHSLCSCFIRLNKEFSNLCLLIFIYDIDSTAIQNISNNIKELYKICQNKINNINIIPISINNDIESLMLCHNTGDIFLDISENNKTPLNYSLAKQMNNKILDFTNIDMSISLTRNNVYFSDGVSYINTDNIYTNLKNILVSHDIKNTDLNFKLIDSDII